MKLSPGSQKVLTNLKGKGGRPISLSQALDALPKKERMGFLQQFPFLRDDHWIKVANEGEQGEHAGWRGKADEHCVLSAGMRLRRVRCIPMAISQPRREVEEIEEPSLSSKERRRMRLQAGLVLPKNGR